MRSLTPKRKSSSRAGTQSAMTSNWPSSTPTLNASSDVSRCDPANCSVSRSANEKPKPCTRPKPKATTQRRRMRTAPAAPAAPAATMFSSAM